MELRRIVIPLATTYALFVAMALHALRRPPPSPRARDARAGWGPLIRHVAVTVGGGYAAFLLVVLVFHVLIAGQGGALASAASGGAFLSIVAAAAFVLLSLAVGRRPG